MADAVVRVVDGRAVAYPSGAGLIQPFLDAARAARDVAVVNGNAATKSAADLAAFATRAGLAAARAEAAAYAGRRVAIVAQSYGQSLALAEAGQVTTQPTTGVFTLSGGSEVIGFPDYLNSPQLAQTVGNFADLKPFAEPAGKEGWGSGTGAQWMREPDVEQVIYFAPGLPGANWSNIRPGSGWWTNAEYGLRRAAELAHAQGLAVEFDLWLTMGEADADNHDPGNNPGEAPATADEIVDIIGQARDAYWRACAAIPNAPRKPMLWVTPMLTQLPLVGGAGPRQVQNGQVLAAATLGGVDLLPSPCQFVAGYLGDLVHLGGAGKRLYAEAATLMKRDRRAGGNRRALRMLKASRAGATVTLTFSEPIAIDTTTIAETTAFPEQNKGFQWWSGSAFIAVTNVAVAGSTATLTLASNPGGAGEVRMSQQQASTVGNPAVAMPRSNIRAVTPLGSSIDGTTLHNFAVPQGIACA